MTIPQDNWYRLTFPKPAELNKVCQQLHHAAQFVAVAGYSMLPEASDDSPTNMEWIPELKALASNEIELKQRFRVALLFESFELQIIDPNLNILGTFPLSGQTKTTAMSFVRTQVRTLGGNPNQIKAMTHFELPQHPTDQGGPFVMISPKHHHELARYRHNTHFIIQEFSKLFEHASPVRTWPHHFDMASLIPVTFNDLAEPTKTVGIGLSIADNMIDEHYFYINHWAQDDEIDYSNLPALEHGAWLQGDWKGAVLKMSEVIGEETVKGQREMVWQFFQLATNASLKLLGAETMKV